MQHLEEFWSEILPFVKKVEGHLPPYDRTDTPEDPEDWFYSPVDEFNMLSGLFIF